MAQPPHKIIKLEVETIENGFLLIKNRTDDYVGQRFYCENESALADKVDSHLRMWARMEEKKRNKR